MLLRHLTTRKSLFSPALLLLLTLPAFSQTPPPAPTQSQQQSPTTTDKPACPDQFTPEEKSQILNATKDWPGLSTYRDIDHDLPPASPSEPRVVFLGDSITEAWGRPGSVPPIPFFPGKPYFNRGISGQTSPQMLLRFRQDVINLHPQVVVLLAGTNDIAQNTGPESLEEIEGYIQSIVELARANHIRVVLCSVLPASDFPWRPGLNPAPKIRQLNSWLKSYAANNHIVYADYYSALATPEGGLRSDLSPDGVHPNAAGYALMAPIASSAINAALK